MGPRRPQKHRDAGCTPDPGVNARGKTMPHFAGSRRRFLQMAAAGLSVAATSRAAKAQFVPTPGSSEDASTGAATPIEVKARPIPWFDRHDHDRLRFGALEYRSGLALASPFPRFGGLSGLRLDAKGERFISFSDRGHWFAGRILYQGRAMTGLADVETAPMLGSDGKPITARGWYDSESIAIDGSLVYIGLERVNKVLRFDFSKGFTRSRGEVVPLPPAARKLPFNKGLEALIFVPKGLPLAGTLIEMSERGLDANGNLIRGVPAYEPIYTDAYLSDRFYCVATTAPFSDEPIRPKCSDIVVIRSYSSRPSSLIACAFAASASCRQP